MRISASPRDRRRSFDAAPCPVYEWAVSNLTSCSAFCGTGGTATRRVSCRKYASDLSIHFLFVDVNDALCDARPKTDLQPSLRTPTETCWRNVAGGKNGGCDRYTNKCVCRSSFTGQACTRSTTAIRDVQLSGAEVYGGIPLGELLSVPQLCRL
jgi:hypothetical protein